MKSHVFVSHAWTDKDVVLRLREALEPDDVRLWIDNREMAGGDDLYGEIETAIDGAEHVIVVLSPEALKAAGVKREVAHAREARSRRDDGLSAPRDRRSASRAPAGATTRRPAGARPTTRRSRSRSTPRAARRRRPRAHPQRQYH